MRLGLGLGMSMPTAILSGGDPPPPDTTAPTLSSASGTQTGPTTATLSVTSNEAGGTLYAFVSTSATPPNAATLRAGTGAVYASSKTAASGANTFSATGLTASTAYYAHFLQDDAAANASAIVSSASFTTAAAADTTAPTLSSPTGTQTGSTTATLGVTTNEANGTLYSFVSTSATPPSGTDLKAGTGAVFANSQTITTTGAKTASATGLTASTAYYVHWLHRDAAGNDSTIATSASFTTAASGVTYMVGPDDASWTKVDVTVAANQVNSPVGTMTAEKSTEVVSSNVHRLQYPQTIVSGANYEISCLVKDIDQRYVTLGLNTASNSAQWFGATFDLTAVSVTQTNSATSGVHVSSSITADPGGDGWYLIKVRGNLPTTSALMMIGHVNAATWNTPSGRSTHNYAGAGKAFYVDGIQFVAV